MPAAAREAPGLQLAGRTVVVVGLAASGLAATRVLRELGAEVRVTERRPLEELGADARAAVDVGAEVLAGGHVPEHLRGADVVVTSPGVPEGADVLRWARDRGIPVWSEIEVGARLAAVPYVGVTGTNGKTTVTRMIAAVLERDGRRAAACGNAGHPFSLAATEDHDALVVEVSSFQLRFHETFHPVVSVLLNLAPDHLDWHGGPEAYREAKRRILELQGPGDTHVGNAADEEAAAVSREAPCPVVWFRSGEPGEGEVGWVGDRLVARMDGEHDLGAPGAPTQARRENAAAAAATSLAFGASPRAVTDGLAAFQPLAHRGEVVAEVEGVRFVDDSKATNPHAALASIKGQREPVLIAGGLHKGVDLTPLGEVAADLRGAVVLGEAADALARIFESGTQVARVASIEEAVRTAFSMARAGGTVLLAPACASQDMFRDYAERGERFAAAARSLGDG